MKLVIALEGSDGSGKSSLARFIEALCKQQGKNCTRIGRRSHSASPVVAKLTELLRAEAGNMTPRTEVHLRIARAYQRAYLAALAPPEVVVINRFVLSILSRARLNGPGAEHLIPMLKELTAISELHATIYVKCPFEMAWGRVKNRQAWLLPTQTLSETLLRRTAEFLEEDFGSGVLTGRQWLVDNSGTLEQSHEQITSYLLPYLQSG
jgi:thymidylate kinase